MVIWKGKNVAVMMREQKIFYYVKREMSRELLGTARVHMYLFIFAYWNLSMIRRSISIIPRKLIYGNN